jgi:hypothetical protein
VGQILPRASDKIRGLYRRGNIFWFADLTRQVNGLFAGLEAVAEFQAIRRADEPPIAAFGDRLGLFCQFRTGGVSLRLTGG